MVLFKDQANRNIDPVKFIDSFGSLGRVTGIPIRVGGYLPGFLVAVPC